MTIEKLLDICDKLIEEGIDVALFSDFEGSRDVNVKFLTGHPENALVAVVDTGDIIIAPWDIELARKRVDGATIVEWRQDEKSMLKALTEGIKEACSVVNPAFAVDYNFPYGAAKQIAHQFGVDLFEDFSFNKLDKIMLEARAVKTDREIEIVRKTMAITSKVIDRVEEYIRETPTLTERELADFLKREGESLGAEKLSFDTIVANSERSWQIYPDPRVTNRELKLKGLALVDFGFSVEGMLSDVTIPLVFGNITEEKQKMINTAKRAYEEAIAVIKDGVHVSRPAGIANEIISEAGYKIYHGLGHGIGLAEKEEPNLYETKIEGYPDPVLKAGMVVTIEPGVYIPKFGGVRLENDVLITEKGYELLTNSRFMYF